MTFNNKTLFDIDNTKVIAKWVREQINDYNGVLKGKDLIIHFIREGVEIFSPNMMFLQRISFIESIYEKEFANE